MPSPNIIGHTHSFPSDKPRGGSIAPEKKYDERCPDEELSQSIAIIGLSLKFPQEASSAEGFWDMLMEKRCAMTEVPQQRYNIDAFHGTDSVRKDQVRARGGHFVAEDLSFFDAPFFSITSVEACAMDVQQRQILECVYRALENAGIPLTSVDGTNTSVYTGSFADDYRLMLMRDQNSLPKYAATGSSLSILANRISWFYNLHGPSLQVDTACSSSLLALHLAFQGLVSKESDMSIVAGSNTIFGLDMSILLSNMNFLSPDSRCYSFDHRANGYARGEGFGVLVLKRVSDALRDGDSIRAVIRATGSNSDGRTRGLTQPSGEAQQRLIRETYAKANLEPSTTRFFEAHGPGTMVGDPIEANAIGAVFKQHRSSLEPLFIGAVKSNIGHLEGASGIASVMKTILCLEKGVIPPNANFEKLNSQIDASFLNLAFPTQAIPWPSCGVRRASVNSFGFGGSNVHVVLDDAHNFLKHHRLVGFHNTVAMPPTLDPLVDHSVFQHHSLALSENIAKNSNDLKHIPVLLVWSAADECGVKRLLDVYNAHFKESHSRILQEPHYLADLANTLSERRTSLSWRVCAVANSLLDLREKGVPVTQGTRSSHNLSVGFIFTGQGAQYAGMGRDLLEYAVFKNTLIQVQSCLQELQCGWSLMEELLKDDCSSLINRPDIGQPLCTALQIALVELLRSFNITPRAVVGHSSGEIAAAYCIGALTMQSACRAAFLRGKLASQLSSRLSEKAGMMAVGLSESDIAFYLDLVRAKSSWTGQIVVACVNSPRTVTVAGDRHQIDILHDILKDKDIFARKLLVDVAYHSPYIECIAGEYALQLGQLQPSRLSSGSTPVMISSVTAKPVTDIHALANSCYWVQNLVSPVRFSDALCLLLPSKAKRGFKKLGGSHQMNKSPLAAVQYLLEIGPHSTLASAVKDTLSFRKNQYHEVCYGSCLTRGASALNTTMAAVGRLWCSGYPVKLQAVNNLSAEKIQRHKSLTDLPEYPFDHSKSYWHESRISREYRLRKHPQLDLLGTPSTDCNPLEAKWTKFIRPTETPWIVDHVVNGRIIYPRAGILVMAIEGARQIAQDAGVGLPIHAYRVLEATFEQDLIMDMTTEQGTESQLYIRRHSSVIYQQATRFDFRVCALGSEKWEEKCRGLIQVEYKQHVDGEHEPDTQLKMADFWMRRNERCCEAVQVSALYDEFRQMGVRLGPAFRALDRVKYNAQGEVIANVKAFQWEQSGYDNHNPRQDHLIHPTTLHAFMQVAIVGLANGTSIFTPIAFPTRITDMWLSSSGVANPEVTTQRAVSTLIKQTSRHSESCLILIDHDNNLRAMICIMETRTNSQPLNREDDDHQRLLCYYMNWKPDIDQLSQRGAEHIFGRGRSVDTDTARFYDGLACFQSLAIHDTLARLDPAHVSSTKSKYVTWMREQVQLANSTATRSPSSETFDDMSSRLSDFSVEGRFYVEVARKLLPTLHGQLDPTELLVTGHLVKDYYSEIDSRLFPVLAQFLGLMAHKNSALRVLEVGANKGGITRHIIGTVLEGFGNGEAVQSDRSPHCVQCDCTSSSPAFVETAQREFSAYASHLRFSELDIEKNPVQQGFESQSYDLVITSHLLDRCQDCEKTLRHVHSLIKPGGKLVLLEKTGNSHRAGFAFGLLPNWWLSRGDILPSGSKASPMAWDLVLKRSSFSGADFLLNDYADEAYQELSLLVATANPQPELPSKSISTSAPVILTIVRQDSASQKQLADIIQQGVATEFGFRCKTHCLDEENDVEMSSTFVIFLIELDSPQLHSLHESLFQKLRSILLRASSLIWVTGGGGTRWETPEYNVADGFLRTLRTEHPTLKAVTLALSPERTHADKAMTVQKVLAKLVASDNYGLEVEYREQHGILFINRVAPADALNERIFSSTRRRFFPIESLNISEAPPLALHAKSLGLPDSLCFITDKDQGQPLKPDDVEVKVQAAGMCFIDFLPASDQSSEIRFGGEYVGTITRTGTHARENLRPGDQVCGAAFGALTTHVRIDARMIRKIPSSIASPDAASWPIIYTAVAYYALIVTARLQEGDKLLIHNAAGGAGQLAVQVAQQAGAEVFATVGSCGEKQLLLGLYAIPHDHIFQGWSSSFVRGIERMTQNRSMDVIWTDLAVEDLSSSFSFLSNFGRVVAISKGDDSLHSLLNDVMMLKNISFSIVDVRNLLNERPPLWRASYAAAMDLIATSLAKAPLPQQMYTVNQLKTAFHDMQSDGNTGKAVIDFLGGEPDLQSASPLPVTCCLDPNATYVIAGGFGGIARRTARWMADRGARYLLLLGRSGPESDSARSLVNKLQSRGIQICAPPCNIACKEALGSALSECAKAMPPIKGCIQAAMVLRDAPFDGMTYDQWAQALLPKMHGSRNLDSLLPHGLDFFIMLSSIAGIHGSMGQANYAAGGSYQDALARHRVSRGERATVLDLGWMVSDGAIAESEFLTRAFKASGAMMPINADEYLTLLDYYCNPTTIADLDHRTCQAIVGLETPSGLIAQGADIPSFLRRSTFQYLHSAVDPHQQSPEGGQKAEHSNSSSGTKVLSYRFKRARTPTEAQEIVVEGLLHKLSRALSVPPCDIDCARPLHLYGVDSLLAVDLRGWIAEEFGADIAVSEIMGTSTFAFLASSIIRSSRIAQKLCVEDRAEG